MGKATVYLPAEVSGRRRAQEGDLAAGIWTDASRESFEEVGRRTRILKLTSHITVVLGAGK